MAILFKGIRASFTSDEDNVVIFSVDGGEKWANVPLYIDEVNHSPTGFEWGYRGSGPAQLAYALLRVYFRVCHGDDTQDDARALYKYFKDDIICALHEPEWIISGDIITYWLKTEMGWEGILSNTITSGCPVIKE